MTLDGTVALVTLWVRDDLIPALNQTVKQAAAEAGVVFADITDATRGHELCSDPADRRRWINGVRVGDDQLGGTVGSETFHPNQWVHDAIAKYFTDHYTNAAGKLTVHNPPAASKAIEASPRARSAGSCPPA